MAAITTEPIMLKNLPLIRGGGGGDIFEKRYDAHPPSWLVVSAGQQKRSQKLGDFFCRQEFRFWQYKW